eukprot:1178718-Prorocentrum_minimum.AAC.2
MNKCGNKMEEINLGGGSKIYYKRKLVGEEESNEMYKRLLDNEIEWEKKELAVSVASIGCVRCVCAHYPAGCGGRCVDRGVARAILSCQTDGPDHRDCKTLNRTVAKLKPEVRAVYNKGETSLRVFDGDD